MRSFAIATLVGAVLGVKLTEMTEEGPLTFEQDGFLEENGFYEEDGCNGPPAYLMGSADGGMPGDCG